MKQGTENRKKMIAAGGLGTAALICLIYAYNQLFGGTTNPAATAAPTPTPSGPSATQSVLTTSATSRNSNAANATAPTVIIPGAAARKLATSSAALDPTLDQTAMLRTEHLVYAGTGRNIFSATYTPPPPAVPKNIPPARPVQRPVYVPPVQTGPPPPPPINLKFFGTATRAGGQKQAFLLQGEDVYLASPGDIVARKYKIGAIGSNSLQVTDLQNNNTQTLALQQ